MSVFNNLTHKSPSLFDVIIAPLVTEKATLAAEKGQYIFKIAPHATKNDVKVAVEALYSVKVIKVNTLSIEGKNKRFRGRYGKRRSVKKAIVRVAEGQTINLGMEA